MFGGLPFTVDRLKYCVSVSVSVPGCMRICWYMRRRRCVY